VPRWSAFSILALPAHSQSKGFGLTVPSRVSSKLRRHERSSVGTDPDLLDAPRVYPRVRSFPPISRIVTNPLGRQLCHQFLVNVNA